MSPAPPGPALGLGPRRRLEVTVDAAVVTIALDRPAARNALDRVLCDELVEVGTALAGPAGDEVAAVVLRARGPVFCAGADLKERQGMDAEAARGRRQAAYDAYAAFESLPQPSVAVIEGPAVGSGCELAAACDLRVASDAASFRYPEVGWGTIGATQRLPLLVGLAAAKDLLLTGREVGAAEALALGLVNRVAPAQEVDPVLAALLEPILAAPPAVVRLLKRTLDAPTADHRRSALDAERAAVDEVLGADGWRQRIDGFGS